MLATGTVICLGVRLRNQPTTAEMVENNLCFYPTFGAGQKISIAYNYTGGSLLKWYRDHVAGEELAQAAERGLDPYEVICADLPADPSGVIVLPHFSMTGTPWLDPKALGAVLGLRLTTGRKELVKGILEGILYEIRLNAELLGNAGVEIDLYKAIGGAARSDTWMQIAADILGRPVAVLSVKEVASLGAALMGAHAAGIVSSEQDAYDIVERSATIRRVFEPRPDFAKKYDDRFAIYRDGVSDDSRPQPPNFFTRRMTFRRHRPVPSGSPSRTRRTIRALVVAGARGVGSRRSVGVSLQRARRRLRRQGRTGISTPSSERRGLAERSTRGAERQ